VVTTNNGPTAGFPFTVSAGATISSVSPTKGGIGAAVTITGIAFGQTQGTSTVKFNGTIAAPSSWSDSSIVVPVPSGATTGNIVVVVGGGTSNGINFTVSGVSISALTPSTGNTGQAVVITGSGFGTTQGSSTITFNGTKPTVTSWSNTSISTTVPAAATSGPVVVTVSGAPSDPVNFTAQPLITGISPEPAAQGATVTITGENFGSTQGSSVLTCNGSPTYVTSWSASSVVLSGCVSNIGSNPIQIVVNGVSSDVATIDGIPDPTLKSVNPMTAPVGARVVIVGTNLGSTQGSSTVTINGVAATPTSWSSSKIVVTVPATATGNGAVTVTVGGVASSLYGFQVGTYPAPNSVRISPTGVNLVIGPTQQFTAVDEFGRPRADATWTVDNTTLATITTDYSPILTPVAAGTVTLTATVQGVSAQTQVTISALASLSLGTTIWSAPAVPGFTPVGVFQAVPTDYGPSLYSVQTSTDGTQTAIQAVTSDGQVLWETTLPWPYGGTSVPDGFGGLLVIGACNANASPAISLSITDVEPVFGGARWGMQFPTVYNGTPMCVTGTPKMAIRQDGAVVVAMPVQISPALLVLDGQSGGELPITPAIPPSTMTGTQGEPLSCDCLTPVGQPIVDSDGSVYVEYDVEETQLTNGQLTWNFSLPAASTSSILSLLKIAPDGSTTTTQLGSATSAALMPGNIIPDGQGGVLATWALINVPTLANNWNPPIAPQPYQAADVSSGTVLSTYALPNSPQGQLVPIGSDGLPIQPPLVLGENGTAFTSYPPTGPIPPTVTSFNLNAGSANWAYQAPPQTSASLVTLTPSNGIAVKTTDSNGTDTVTLFDAGGNASILGTAGSSLSYSWQGAWNGISNGLMATIALPFVPVNTISAFAEPGGSSSSNGESVVHHSFGLFWCGSAYAAQGYYSGTGSPCTQGGGHDIFWGYYRCPEDSCPGAGQNAQEFDNAYPNWVAIIQTQAINAFRQAYLKYGIQVTLATFHPACAWSVCLADPSQDQEYDVFVIGDYPYGGAGKEYSDYSSVVWYYALMEGAQQALGHYPNPPYQAGWVFTSPNYPPGNPQDTATFVSIMTATGTAIGNGAAHEIGHHLEKIKTLKAAGNMIFPYMDCGAGNQPPPPALPVPCEDNDNFVYSFYNAAGSVQYGGTSPGAMFRYGVAGGTGGIPFQPAIHWGTSENCWLWEYMGKTCPAQ